MRDKDSKILEEKYLSILEAVVPVSKMRDVRKGLRKKYGRSEYIKRFTKNTFGFDIEFDVEKPNENFENEVSDELRDIFYSQKHRSKNKLNEIVYEFMEPKYENYYQNYTDGYLSVDDWEYDNPEPERPENYFNIESDNEYNEYYEKIYDEWKNKKDRIEEYLENIPTIEDYWNEFIRFFIENQYYTYSEFYDLFLDSMMYTVDGEIDFLEYNLEKEILNKYSSDISDDGWEISNDAGLLEITSPICTTNDLPMVLDVLEYLQSRYGDHSTGATSAHIHIGVPDNFDVFDAIALYDLIDENKIIEDNRQTSYTKEKLDFFSRLKFQLEKHEKQNTEKIINFSDILPLFSDRYMGVNLSNIYSVFQNKNKNKKNDKKDIIGKSIEFRYPSSRILSNIDYFLKLIQYFMHVSEISKSRNRIFIKTLGIELVRYGSDSIKYRFVKFDSKKIKHKGYPAKDLKT